MKNKGIFMVIQVAFGAVCTKEIQKKIPVMNCLVPIFTRFFERQFSIFIQVQKWIRRIVCVTIVISSKIFLLSDFISSIIHATFNWWSTATDNLDFESYFIRIFFIYTLEQEMAECIKIKCLERKIQVSRQFHVL